ncbi:MAG: hypothetical protein QG585_275 [Patescibacteria group bacterium]|jgi:hypothetical protein|nr:hypothetical protein [Patescibacteria group bacterium]
MIFTKKSAIITTLVLAGWYVFGLFVTNALITSGEVAQNDFKNYNVIFLINLPYILGAVVAFIGRTRISKDSSVGKALLALGLTCASLAMGFVTWFYFETILQIEIPYPSLADIFFILYIPLVIYASIHLLKIFTLGLRKTSIVQALILGLISGFLLFKLAGLEFPTISLDSPLTTSLFDFLYAFADAILIALAVVILRLSGGKMTGGLLFLVLALVSMVASDLVFSARVDQGIYYTGDIGDALFTLTGCLFALSVYKIALNFSPKNEIY